MGYNSGFGLNKPLANNVKNGDGSTRRTGDQVRIHSDDYTEKFRFAAGGATVNVKPKSGNNNEYSNVLDAYGQTFPIYVNTGYVGDDTGVNNYYRDSNTGRGSFKNYSIDLPAFINTSWLYGAAVRIYSDGTGAGVFFLDSEANGETFSRYLQGGGTTQWVQYDSDWNKWGGLLASTTASAPDSDLRNTVADSDWYNSYKNLITNTSENAIRTPEASVSGNKFKNRAVLYEPIGGYDSDFTTRNFIDRDAFENEQASAGTGTADPESWS